VCHVKKIPQSPIFQKTMNYITTSGVRTVLSKELL
jgi:hypothetical protein